MIDRVVGVHEDDRNRFDLLIDQRLRDGARTGVGKFAPDGAVGEHAFVDLEDAVARHERHVFAEEQVERIGPVDAADLIRVAKAAGGDQRRMRAFALEDRVDRNRRTVNDEVGVGGLRAGRGDRIEDAAHEIIRSTQRFPQRHRSVGRIEHRHIRECAPDIDADA